jgi:hypothetical protein
MHVDQAVAAIPSPTSPGQRDVSAAGTPTVDQIVGRRLIGRAALSTDDPAVVYPRPFTQGEGQDAAKSFG